MTEETNMSQAKKKKTRNKRPPLSKRVTVLEESFANLFKAVEALEDEPHAPAPVKQVFIPIPKPTIPLGYEQCELEDADRWKNNNNWVLQLFFLQIKWEVPEFCWPDAASNKAGREIYLRCILPPEVASHWQPAPGETHEEQRSGAWLMGGEGYYKRKFACWCPYTTEVVTSTEFEFKRNLNWVPLVPKANP